MRSKITFHTNQTTHETQQQHPTTRETIKQQHGTLIINHMECNSHIHNIIINQLVIRNQNPLNCTMEQE